MDDYICITNIVDAKSEQSRASDIIRNWLRNRSTLEFLSVWEQLYNPQFKVLESEHFKKQAGLLTFTPSISEWVEQTDAIGLYVNYQSDPSYPSRQFKKSGYACRILLELFLQILGLRGKLHSIYNKVSDTARRFFIATN